MNILHNSLALIFFKENNFFIMSQNPHPSTTGNVRRAYYDSSK